MTDAQTICPYTGLRAFTEEESLFFKGRDIQVDQITALLEQNKFLMVTGASGEGKSSLIYGGLIPNARAGFFKAQYTNWVVADFRPERSPVKNMARALAEKFGAQSSTVETELRRGFSSLVDLYTSSAYFTDEQDEHWKLLPESERKEKKRSAANLLILVDQFEEFFTNPENFHNESLSQDSQVVVNLILETARIALKRNLPVYVVCTMRSDFIGQCSAFRGLPEYIGFSQFFVPRLKRKDLKQVIEDPAILSGNRITQRLIERLVFDLAEGIDQLPILQHALSQIWLAADHGREEMDLIHYAMVGGMAAGDLPDEDQRKFLTWFNSLSEHRRNYFGSTGLAKVIEIHANTMYEGAWEYHNVLHSDRPMTKQTAKRIVAMAFACLTKIDNSRAVRNRMSLKEITDIINSPGITQQDVAAVLGIYREEGSAFIRPFKTEDPATHLLTPDTVLDITHESLIRNWNKLDEWASTEFEYYTTFLDFKTQLNRWMENGKNSGYLLPIGPLTYFENWYAKCKPNAGWIIRYSENKSEDIVGQKEREGDAQVVLFNTADFLKKSAAKVAVSRAFMKYGTQRIVSAMAIVVMLVLSGFYWYDAEQKRNSRVIEQVRTQSRKLLSSSEVNTGAKANYLLVEERYGEGYMLPYLEGLGTKDKASVSIEVYKQLLRMDKHFQNPVKDNLVDFIARSFTTADFESDLALAMSNRNKFIMLLAFDEYYNPGEAKRKILMDMANANLQATIKFFKDVGLFKPTVPTEINQAIQAWLTFSKPDQAQIAALIELISPWQSENAKKVFNTYFAKGSFEPNGREPIDFNGGYHTLATLYGSVGSVEDIIHCIDAMTNGGQKNYLELARVFNNHISVIGYLYQYGHRDKVPQFLKWIGLNSKDNPPQTLLRNAMIRAGYMNHLYYINIDKQTRSHKGNLYFNLSLADRGVFDALMEDYEAAIRDVRDADERNYLLAMHYKRKAVFIHKYQYDRSLPMDTVQLNSLFDNAVKYYRMVGKDYLDGKATISIPYNTDGVRERTYARNQLFIYPDYMDGWFSRPYHSDVFFQYLNSRQLLGELYQTSNDLEILHLWISKAFEFPPPFFDNSRPYRNDFPLSNQVLIDIFNFVKGHPKGKDFDTNLPILIVTNRFLEANDTTNGLKYFRLVDQTRFQSSRNRYEYLEKTFFLNQVKELCVRLAVINRHKEAIALAELIPEDYIRVYSYLFMAQGSYRADTSAMTFVYLDSVFSINKRIDFNFSPLDDRFNLIQVLSYIGGKEINEKSMEVLRDFGVNGKVGGTFDMIFGVAREGNFYRAMTLMPPTFTESQELRCGAIILYEACRKNELTGAAMVWKGMDETVRLNNEYIDFVSN